MNSPVSRSQDWLNTMNAGMSSFQIGRIGNAVNAFDRATKIQPERVEGWVNLGSALLEAKRLEAAAVALRKAISIDPKFMVSHMVYGDVQRQQGQVNQAIESYRMAVSLQTSPMGLNKLACMLRTRRKTLEAADFYRQAIALDHRFTLAKVNLATLQLEMSNFEEASEHLNALASLKLTPVEREEVEKSQLALSQYFHLKEALDILITENDLAPLEKALAQTLPGAERVDTGALQSIRKYVKTGNQLVDIPAIAVTDLPAEWPLIEAMFMIPFVNSVSEYLEFKAGNDKGEKATGALLESVNMEAVILAARATRDEIHDPVKAEMHLRHWHALSGRDVAGFSPGHFKYTQNWTHNSPTKKRVEPALASSTFRCFISDIYPELEPGLIRAAIVWMAVCDLHPFADGNGRVAFSWMNRELEWAGLMPALFSRELGLKGELGDVMRNVRAGNGDLSTVIAVITRAQHHAVAFCNELAGI